jgi:hypothetical protein
MSITLDLSVQTWRCRFFPGNGYRQGRWIGCSFMGVFHRAFRSAADVIQAAMMACWFLRGKWKQKEV